MTTTEAPAPAFRYIGLTDENTVCDKCGKVELRATVVVMPLDDDGNDEGEPLYYGSTCAARALAIPGGGAKVRKAAAGAALRTRSIAANARERLAFYGVAEDGDYDRKAVTAKYARTNPDPAWTSYEQAQDEADEMIGRYRAAVREARLIGA